MEVVPKGHEVFRAFPAFQAKEARSGVPAKKATQAKGARSGVLALRISIAMSFRAVSMSCPAAPSGRFWARAILASPSLGTPYK